LEATLSMKLRPVLIVLLVLSLFGTAVGLPPPGLPGDDLPDAPTNHHGTYAVEQGASCTEVSPIRGDTNVVDFYDYRTPYTNSSSWAYGYFGDKSFTRDNGSTMFLYQAPSGVTSLVMIHDRMNETRTGNNNPMSTVTFRFDGLPSSGQWVLMDDTYPHRDDQWSRTRLDWIWAGSRTDGGVFRGLSGGSEITVTPSWNEDATLYNPQLEHEPVTSWAVLSGSGGSPSATELDMDSPATIRPGTCGASLQVTLRAAGTASAGTPITLDASQTTDSEGTPKEYRWDYDDDGTVDETTTRPTTTHTYTEPGEHVARVTVTDSNDHTASATTPVTVERTEADIRVTGVSLDRTQVSKGENVKVTATFENTGDGGGTVPAVLAVGDSVGDRKRVHVRPGETKTVTYTYKVTESGNQVVAVNGVSAGTLVIQQPTTNRKTTTHSKPGNGTNHGLHDSQSLPGPNVVFDHPGVSGFVVALLLLGAAFVARR
jgi:PKD repeat protein